MGLNEKSLPKQMITTDRTRTQHKDFKFGRFLTYKKGINVMNVKPFFISKNQLKNLSNWEPIFSKHKIEPIIFFLCKRIKLFMNFECARNIETNRITVAFFCKFFSIDRQ